MNRGQVGIQVEHSPHSRNDLGYGTSIRKVQGQLKRIGCGRLDRKRTVYAMQVDAARVDTLDHPFQTHDRPRRQEPQQRRPVIGRLVRQQHPHRLSTPLYNP